jgi:hypothetical protein
VRIHFDVLGWLYILAGAFGFLTGISLFILALGTDAALANTDSGRGAPTTWFFILSGSLFLLGGILMALAGRAVVQRKRRGRTAVLLLALPNLAVIPFGTALGVYTFWTLLNDDARREFGRPIRAVRGS